MLHGSGGGTSPLRDAEVPVDFRYQQDLSGLSCCLRLGWILGGMAPRKVEFQPSPSQTRAPGGRVRGGCRVRMEFMTLHQTSWDLGGDRAAFSHLSAIHPLPHSS